MAEPSQFAIDLEEYYRLMGRTQRNPPPEIGAPAITRHFALRIPPILEPEKAARQKESENGAQQKGWTQHREEWIKSVENFIIQFCECIKANKEIELPPNPELTPNLQQRKTDDNERRLYLFNNSYDEFLNRKPVDRPDRYPAVRFNFLWQSMPVEVSFQLHTEYFTISTVIDLSRKIPSTAGNASRELKEAIDTVDNVLSRRYRHVSRTEKSVPRSEDENSFKGPKGAYRTIYYNVWDQFHEAMFAELLQKEQEKIGTEFAEFRGFIISRGKTEKSLLRPFGGREKFIAPPGHAHRDPPSEVLIRKPFDDRETAICAETLIPFMRAANGNPAEPMEYTATRFLSGIVLHISAFGMPPPAGPEAQPLRVHTDLLYAAHNDPHQLGRLVEIGNILGTLRTVALFDQSELFSANDQLLNIESDVDSIARRMPDIEASDEKKEPKKDQSEPVKRKEKESSIRQLTADLLRATRQLAEISVDVPGGLAERVDQSQRYRQDFERLSKLIRDRRIEGWQPYLQFLTRRVGGTFDVIDRIGARFS